MRRENKPKIRDDAETQPESGYPGGRMSTKPSAGPSRDERIRDAATGSESEFDSKKPNSQGRKR